MLHCSMGIVRGLGVACLATALFGAACSSGGSTRGGNGTACSSITPCGGDPVGTWALSSFCVVGGWQQLLDDMYTQPECSDVLASLDLDATGTLVTNADGTYTQEAHLEMTMHMVYTRECIGALAGTEVTDANLQDYCASMNAALSEPDPDSTVESGSCSVADSACRCTSQGSDGTLDIGTYVVDGTTITATSADGDTNVIPFCVQGNELQQEEDIDDATAVTVYHRS